MLSGKKVIYRCRVVSTLVDIKAFTGICMYLRKYLGRYSTGLQLKDELRKILTNV